MSLVSKETRERYVAWRRAEAELSAWRQVTGEDSSSKEHEQRLRTRNASALKLLLEARTECVGDLILKLQIIKTEPAGHVFLEGQASALIADMAQLAGPLIDLEAQLMALQTVTNIMLNSLADDRAALSRAREAAAETIDQIVMTREGVDAAVAACAKQRLDPLFSWID